MNDYSSYRRENSRSSGERSSSRRKSTPRDSRPASGSAWDSSARNNQYNQQQQMQTAYQHLQSGTMYNNTNQYPNQSYYAGYGNYGNYNPYQYNQAAQQQYMSGTVQPGPPGEEYPQGGWAPVAGYAQTGTGEFNQNNASATVVSTDKNYKAEVVEELNKQKANLIKERETYEEKVSMLHKKLGILVKQKEELSAKHATDRETQNIIKENSKLQNEIQSKIKDANNVIDILSGLIGDKKRMLAEEAAKPAVTEEPKVDKVNYKHYDPEIHWCRMCDVFPQSAKELLVHLHSKKHQETSQEEIPWHKQPSEPKFPVYEGAPVRRLPIKGLQFFVASTAWYCRLCDSWIGDLHCASQHLMSVTHSQNYSNFVEQNPHWEIEWLKDREKALERMKRNKSGSDSDSKKRRRRKHSPGGSSNKDKKKKKKKRRRRQSTDSSSSSSSSSSSDDDNDRDDKSKSIHVAMRNKMKMLSESGGRWDILGKLVEEERKRQELKLNEEKEKQSPKEDKLMSQWMTISEPPDKDKQLLDSLKEKLKQKHDAEKAKMAAEYEAAKLEKEKEEYERKRREKERQEQMEREEEEKRREKMSMKLKDQVKIKSRENNYRRHRSPSRSPEDRHRRSRSNGRDEKTRNGKRIYDESPNQRHIKEQNRHKEEEKRDKKVPIVNKKLPFIGRMPLFKNSKGKKQEDDKKEIQKEDYDIPRKTRFQPGNLARAFIPEPEVVCFPKLSTYPPIAPPPPVLTAEVPEPPKISDPKPPPPPKIDKELEAKNASAQASEVSNAQEDEYHMLYEDSSNNMMYSYGNMDFNMMYQPPPESFNFMQVPQNTSNSDIPPLEPPPLPPDDPNDDLALLGISSDDLAVRQMF